MGGSEEKGGKEKRGEKEKRGKKEGGREGKHKMYDGVAYFH